MMGKLEDVEFWGIQCPRPGCDCIMSVDIPGMLLNTALVFSSQEEALAMAKILDKEGLRIVELKLSKKESSPLVDAKLRQLQ